MRKKYKKHRKSYFTKSGKRILLAFAIFYIASSCLSYIRACSYAKSMSPYDYQIYPSYFGYIVPYDQEMNTPFFHVLKKEGDFLHMISWLHVLAFDGKINPPPRSKYNSCGAYNSEHINDDYCGMPPQNNDYYEEDFDWDYTLEVIKANILNNLVSLSKPFAYIGIKAATYTNNFGTQCAVVFTEDNPYIIKVPSVRNKFMILSKAKAKNITFKARIYGSGIPYVGPYKEVTFPAISGI